MAYTCHHENWGPKRHNAIFLRSHSQSLSTAQGCQVDGSCLALSKLQSPLIGWNHSPDLFQNGLPFADWLGPQVSHGAPWRPSLRLFQSILSPLLVVAAQLVAAPVNDLPGCIWVILLTFSYLFLFSSVFYWGDYNGLQNILGCNWNKGLNWKWSSAFHGLRPTTRRIVIQ